MLSFESLFNISLCCIKRHVRHIVWSPGEAGAAAGAAAGVPGAARCCRIPGMLGGSRGHVWCGARGPGVGRALRAPGSSAAQLLASNHARPVPDN